MSFQLYAKQKGIKLLKDDVIFIKECLAKMPYNLRRSVLERYSEEWLKGMGRSDIVSLRMNLGRRRANTYLRELSK
jgi:hypothetical protein